MHSSHKSDDSPNSNYDLHYHAVSKLSETPPFHVGLLGAIGLPVFASGGAGFHVLVGPSAGYLWFDLVYAGLASYLTHTNSGVVRIFLANLLGDSLVFVGGILSLHYLAGMPFDKALAVGVIPFIIPDLAKIIAISFIGRPLLQRLRTQSYFSSKS